jgi:hypothetical protein
MVGTREAPRRNDFPSEGTKAPLHPIANDGPADFPRDRESDAHGRVRILPVADEEDESGCRRALARIGGKKVGPALDGR